MPADKKSRLRRLARFQPGRQHVRCTPMAAGENGVEVPLNGITDALQSGVHLTASAANGIVAVDDSGAWAGATDVELPFP